MPNMNLPSTIAWLPLPASITRGLKRLNLCSEVGCCSPLPLPASITRGLKHWGWFWRPLGALPSLTRLDHERIETAPTGIRMACPIRLPLPASITRGLKPEAK